MQWQGLEHYLFSWELLGVLCGIGSVGLLARGYALGFIIGLANTFIYIYLDLSRSIYGQVLVNLYYVVMNVWGFFLWTIKNKEKKPALRFSYATRKEQIGIAVLLINCFLLLFISNRLAIYYGFSQAKTPFLDSLTTSLIFTAMYLSAHKKIEGWYVWLLINMMSMILFFLNGLYITIAQYAVYFVIALIGWHSWVKKYKAQNAVP